MVAIGLSSIEEKVKVSKATRKVFIGLHDAVAKSLDLANQALTANDLEAAVAVISMKDQIADIATKASAHCAERLVSDDPNRMNTYAREVEMIEAYKAHLLSGQACRQGGGGGYCRGRGDHRRGCCLRNLNRSGGPFHAGRLACRSSAATHRACLEYFGSIESSATVTVCLRTGEGRYSHVSANSSTRYIYPACLWLLDQPGFQADICGRCHFPFRHAVS